MDTNKNQLAAEQLFASHSDKNIVYFTSDGFAFFEKQNAESHAFTLDDKSLDAHARKDLVTSLLPDEEGGEDPEAETAPPVAPARKATTKK